MVKANHSFLPIALFLGPNVYNETETITKYEIMDGAPVRGEGTSNNFLRISAGWTCAANTSPFCFLRPSPLSSYQASPFLFGCFWPAMTWRRPCAMSTKSLACATTSIWCWWTKRCVRVLAVRIESLLPDACPKRSLPRSTLLPFSTIPPAGPALF